jgi:hypothetical protein
MGTMMFSAARTMQSAPAKQTGRWIHASSRPVCLLPEGTNFSDYTLEQQETEPGG